MLAMPASKVRRVRREGFSKNITICLPASAARKCDGRAFIKPARWKISSISCGRRSRGVFQLAGHDFMLSAAFPGLEFMAAAVDQRDISMKQLLVALTGGAVSLPP